MNLNLLSLYEGNIDVDVKNESIVQALSDAWNPIDYLSSQMPTMNSNPTLLPQKIFLTGAKGFIGIHLLFALTDAAHAVTCLIRCGSPEEGILALKEKGQQAELIINWDLVSVVKGDLNVHKLGLSPADEESLRSNIDTILHCGADTHHLHSYARLRNTNVNSTRFLLDLCVAVRPKKFCYISSISVANCSSNQKIVPEGELLIEPTESNGYLLSKWTSEKLISRYARYFNLDFSILRLGNITGHSKTGYGPYENNHFWSFTKGILQLGSFPTLQIKVEMLPVDITCNLISKLLNTYQDGLRVYNITNPVTLDTADYFSILTRRGYPTQEMLPYEWQKQLRHLSENNYLTPIKGFYSGNLGAISPEVKQDNLNHLLLKLKMRIDINYESIIDVYIHYQENKDLMRLEPITAESEHHSAAGFASP
jgi:thioester reductase-like protein